MSNQKHKGCVREKYIDSVGPVCQDIQVPVMLLHLAPSLQRVSITLRVPDNMLCEQCTCIVLLLYHPVHKLLHTRVQYSLFYMILNAYTMHTVHPTNLLNHPTTNNISQLNLFSKITYQSITEASTQGHCKVFSAPYITAHTIHYITTFAGAIDCLLCQFFNDIFAMCLLHHV